MTVKIYMAAGETILNCGRVIFLQMKHPNLVFMLAAATAGCFILQP
jgi:hypothetical protein